MCEKKNPLQLNDELSLSENTSVERSNKHGRQHVALETKPTSQQSLQICFVISLTVLHYADQRQFPNICGVHDGLLPNAMHNLETLSC